MKTLYLECGMGAAGDMLTAALLELLPDRQSFIDQMNGLGLPGVCVEAEPAEKCGITGTHISVTVHGEEEESEDVAEGHEHHHDHDHDHEHHHDHDHDHEHHHDHDHDHEHHHDHDHDHDHEHHHHHHHTSVQDIYGIIDGLALPARV